MSKKYELTDETTDFNGTLLHRIRALRDIEDNRVKAGDLGGWIESESNLSQEGDCWVSGDAYVMEGAKVEDNALVCDDALVKGEASVMEDAIVADHAIVLNKAIVGGGAAIQNNARVGGKAIVGGRANIGGTVKIYGQTIVAGTVECYGEEAICGNMELYDNDDFLHIPNILEGQDNITIGMTGTASEEPLVAYGYIECLPLATFLKEGPLPPEVQEALRVLVRYHMRIEV